MSDIYGTKLKIKIYGASHAPAIGARVTGLPEGFEIDREKLDAFMARRAPGRSLLSTQRREPDKVEFISGVQGTKTCGEELCVEIKNTNQRSKDYDSFADCPRPAHADLTAYLKWHGEMDMAGGGPFSGRMTAPLCAVGSIAMQMLEAKGITVGAHISSVGGVSDGSFDPVNIDADTLKSVSAKDFPVLKDEAGEKMKEIILKAREDQDSVGGTVECAVTGLPGGIGGPLFDGLEARIASAAFAIPAVKGIEFGAGFAVADMHGSENNDPFTVKDGSVVTVTNNHGGILGGISSGMPIIFRVALKPTPSIGKEQDSVSISKMEPCKLTVGGRHDPCIVHRAVPVVEAAAAVAILDAILSENKY